VLTTGASASYNNPMPSTVGTASAAPSLTLTAGGLYTDVLAITQTAPNTLAVTNSLYAGASTGGTLLSQFGGIASGGTYLTNAFDALALGWRAQGNLTPTTINVSRVAVSAVHNTPAFVLSLVRTNLIVAPVGRHLQVSWPADHRGWRLEIQTNNSGAGLTTNWATVPDSTNFYSVGIPIGGTSGSVFLRLAYP
jgi:hypothetical protein